MVALHFKETLKILRRETVTEIVVVVQGGTNRGGTQPPACPESRDRFRESAHMRLFIQQSRRRDPGGIERTACRHYAPDPSLYNYTYTFSILLIQARAVINNFKKETRLYVMTHEFWNREKAVILFFTVGSEHIPKRVFSQREETDAPRQGRGRKRRGETGTGWAQASGCLRRSPAARFSRARSLRCVVRSVRAVLLVLAERAALSFIGNSFTK